MARTRAIRSRIVSKAQWLCDGCGRWRGAASIKYVITEGREIVGQLCVFCCAREHPDPPELVTSEAAQSGGVEDPFSDEGKVTAELWEEVWGGVRESVISENTGETPDRFRK